MSATLEIEWFNSYIVRKAQSKSNSNFFTWPGVAYGVDTNITSSDYTYFVEEARIRGGYNNTATDNGVRAYLDEQYPLQQSRINTLIYSGVFNSRTKATKCETRRKKQKWKGKESKGNCHQSP